MSNNVLNVVNAKSWSWGLNMLGMVERMNGFRFCHVLRIPKQKINMANCGIHVEVTVPVTKLDDGLVDWFDAILLQNVDSVNVIREKKNKAVVRMGGMLIDERNVETRYDEELKTCGAVIATNHTLLEIASRVNPNSCLIPNGVDLEIFKPRENHKPGEPFIVGFAGNIWGMGMEYKGYKYAVQACIQLAPKVEMKTCLHAHTQIPHREMPEQFYHKIDCLVLPSIGEGCSNVTAEALACGVPVITTKVGYHGEMLVDKESVLFCERDIEDIMKKIMLLKEIPGLWRKLSANGRKFAEMNHDVNVVAKAYSEVFEDLIRRNSNGQ